MLLDVASIAIDGYWMMLVVAVVIAIDSAWVILVVVGRWRSFHDTTLFETRYEGDDVAG